MQPSHSLSASASSSKSDWSARHPELLSYLFFAGLVATTFFI